MRIRTLDAHDHMPDQYREFLKGHRALQLVDEKTRLRGEMVWRLASGHTAEITEFGILDESDRRQGLGTQLLDAGMADIQGYFDAIGHPLRRVYLFCDAINAPGRAFWEANEFRLATILVGFYHYCDAALYVRDMEHEDGQPGSDGSPTTAP